jgi:hypothetical protein
MLLHPAFFKPSKQKLAIIIVTDNTDHIDLTIQGQQVIDHIASTTKTQLFTFDLDDLNWRFGADAVYSPPEILIKHQVPNHQGSGLSDTFKKRLYQ